MYAVGRADICMSLFYSLLFIAIHAVENEYFWEVRQEFRKYFLYFLILEIPILFFLRLPLQCFMFIMFQKIGRRLHLSKTRMSEFMDQGSTMPFHIAIVAGAIYVFVQVSSFLLIKTYLRRYVDP